MDGGDMSGRKKPSGSIQTKKRKRKPRIVYINTYDHGLAIHTTLREATKWLCPDGYTAKFIEIVEEN